METEKKRMLFLGILLGLVILFSLLFFFWGTVINRGTLNIFANAPFTVEAIGSDPVSCPSSPCSLKLKGGQTDLIFSKNGYKSMLVSSKIKFLRSSDLNVEFEILPSIKEIKDFPEFKESENLKLEFDNKYNKYKLVKDGDQNPIAYFNSILKNPTVFSSENFALVLENGESGVINAYKVDLENNSREKISLNFSGKISNASFSPDGKYLLIALSDQPNAIINTDDGTSVVIPFKADFNSFSWTGDSQLCFATRQKFQPENFKGNYSGYIKFLESEGNTLLLGIYYPDEGTYAELANFPNFENKSQIGKFQIQSNAFRAYLQIGDKNYEALLKSF